MNSNHILKIAKELNIKTQQVNVAGALLQDNATVPFISRYRKEATGGLDEVAITYIRDRLYQLGELDKRRDSILKSLSDRELLTDELKEKVLSAQTLSTLEDIYLPFRPKRRTRATAAKEKGLEPLAETLFNQQDSTEPVEEARKYIDKEKGIENEEDALGGARDIISEWVNENQDAREKMRHLFGKKGTFKSTVISDQEKIGVKYKDYFSWEEPIATAPSHRILAMRRGEKEGVLKIVLSPPETEALKILETAFVKNDSAAGECVKEAVHDSYKRLLSLSMETEFRVETKKRADESAIKIFADNLKELLLAPSLGQKRVIAIDPGIRTGCKVACLDRQGKLLHTETIYPFRSAKERAESAVCFKALSETHRAEAIAVGNGTAGRESESFVRELHLGEEIPVIMVNESGASVYSASEVAREEFPDLDVSYRGAVSIGRRLMDPLAELVKIDPKSIGVGQYQHDVNQSALKRRLDDVVMSCVNAVGVEINTASEQLLTYVSGLGPQLAKNIIAYRNENGPLRSRTDLKKIPRLGSKAYEQAAGFLRIRDGKNPLDASAVHPESYGIVRKMSEELDCSVSGLMTSSELREKITISDYITETVGIPTLKDILQELAKPGRDPRRQFESITFTDGVNAITDLEPGMHLSGIVTNVTAFGAFVDIGVHQDGLVHISQLADRFVKDPNDIVKVHQSVMVTVLDVDLNRNRISLSMKKNPGQNSSSKVKDQKEMRKKKRKENPKLFNNPFSKALKK